MIDHEAHVRAELDGRILTITINRPNRLNAVDVDTLHSLESILRSTAADENIRVVVLTGEGRAFCAGADLLSLGGSPAVSMAAANEVIRGVVRGTVPIIAAVNGLAVGFGASLACACDLIYAAESAFFEFPFTQLGLMPDGGASWLLPAAIGRVRAAELALLGGRLDAVDAAASGLVTRVYPDAELAGHVARAANALADRPRHALASTKTALTESMFGTFDEVLSRERDGQVELMNSPEFAGRAATRIHRTEPTPPENKGN